MELGQRHSIRAVLCSLAERVTCSTWLMLRKRLHFSAEPSPARLPLLNDLKETQDRELACIPARLLEVWLQLDRVGGEKV